MSAPNRLRALFDVILEEAELNPKFGKRVEAALRGSLRRDEITTPGDEPQDAMAAPPASARRASTRRPPAVLDPMDKFSEGEEALRTHLAKLDIEQLKDIIAEYGMDTARLAMKWKRPDRLVDFILDTVRSRARRGDAFRVPSGSATEREAAPSNAAATEEAGADGKTNGDPPAPAQNQAPAAGRG